MSDYQYGCDIVGTCIGADKVYTDQKTVKSVQQRLHDLAVATGNMSFDPGKIDGIVGPHTNAAVTAFNAAYGWPSDGSKITDGTLTALKRPDVVDPKGYAAQQAADAAVADATTVVSPGEMPMSHPAAPEVPHEHHKKTSPWVYAGTGVGVLLVGGLAFFLGRRG